MPLLPVGWMYRRLGKGFPVAFLLLQLSIGTLVTLGALVLVSVYYRRQITEEEFLRLLVICEVLTVAGLGFGVLKSLPRVRPIKEWIKGRRDPDTALKAWEAAVNLPIRVLRDDAPLAVAFAGIPGVVASALVLGLPWTALIPIFVASGIALGYAAVLSYFAIEIGMAPIIDDIVATLPPEFPFERTGLTLRMKLMTILPLMCVITGLVVAAFAGADSLGVSVAVTLAVVFTIALELMVLLSNSISRPLSRLHRGIHAIERGDYTARVPVTSNDDLGEISDGFNRMAAGLEERERIRTAFGTYLDKEVADYILSEDVSPDGIEVEVSILFCDVRGFTHFASDAEATEVVAALNRLFETVVPIVSRRGGHIDKFLGDGMLAVFGAPEAFEDHADRALAAGREIVEAVEGGEAGDLRVGVGINSGRVVAGSIGGAGRLNFSVIGDPVNVAARVESATRDSGDPLLVTAATRDALREDVALVGRGGFVLKGKTEPCELFALEEFAGLRHAPAPAARGAA